MMNFISNAIYESGINYQNQDNLIFIRYWIDDTLSQNEYKKDYSLNYVQEKCEFKTIVFNEKKSKIDISALEDIEKLEDNWNENGAEKFKKDHIEFAKKIILKLTVQPDIYPTANDSIQLEYENKKGDYLEFEIFWPKKIKMFFYSATKEEETRYLNQDEMNKVINKFYG